MTQKSTTAAPTAQGSQRALTLLAFFAIYVVWGTTFLAIRVAVTEVPPLFAAGIRFFTAGLLLYGTMRLRGAARPSGREWRSLAMMGIPDCLYLSMGRCSGRRSLCLQGLQPVLLATLPLDTLLLEMLVFRQQRFRWKPLLATAAWLCGGSGLASAAWSGADSAAALPGDPCGGGKLVYGISAEPVAAAAAIAATDGRRDDDVGRRCVAPALRAGW